MPTGLINIGNTCYLNSTLQCLVHIDELNMFLDRHPPTDLLIKEYNDLRILIQQGHTHVTPNRFVYVIQHVCNEKKMDLFTSFQQYDLSEFLRFMLNEFHTSLKHSVQIPITGQLTPIDKKCVEMIIRTYSNDYSFIIDQFYGVSVSTIETDKIQSIVPDSFFMLDLPIPSSPNTTIYDCFNLYTDTEHFDWHDDTSNTYIPATKKIQFWKLPKLLFVVFKRFTNENHKNNQPIAVPFIVNLYGLTYELVCVCNHYGNVNGGHYSTVVKKENWIEFDDGTVSIVPDNKVITPHAYCLLFRKNS